MAATVFELFHLSLIEKRQGDMLIEAKTREQWLCFALKARFSFEHYGTEFFWVPKPDENEHVVGIVERRAERRQHLPPDQGGDEVIGQEWQGAIVILDPRHHDDGQKLAFEKDITIGSPNAVLNAMLAVINERPEGGYIIESKPLFDGEGFWEFANRHQHVVRYVDFDLVVPNMFDSAGEFDKALKRTGKNTGATRVRLRLESPDGVSTDADEVKAGVEHSENGGGSVTAKALDGERYSSTRRKRVSKILALPPVDANGNRKFLAFLRNILKREPDDSLDSTDRTGDGPRNNQRLPAKPPKRRR